MKDYLNGYKMTVTNLWSNLLANF